MGSLGFRPPQFSEELAWLPACLQRITDSSVQPRSPSHQQFKLQTTKFLYACAVNSLILKDEWLTDSVTAGSALSPEKYMVLSNQPDTRLTRIGKPVRHDNNGYIFDGVGVMLHGKPYFCTKFAKVIQHGGGRVFKTLLCLSQNLDAEKISMAVVVCEGENRASRHLRQCASERTIPMMPSSWIVRSLYSGKLLPFTEKRHATLHVVMGSDSFLLMELGLRKKEIKSKDSKDTFSGRTAEYSFSGDGLTYSNLIGVQKKRWFGYGKNSLLPFRLSVFLIKLLSDGYAASLRHDLNVVRIT
ncbi:BRCT domain-containing protein [Gossypium australe]|uniref:BRCT domain-containing protein n=1 Tax=Gossypium australe TaxID=47621 RepID=A0A5B6WJE4_9ROSI|nr:BRCT domain-containing protein [Gossypium australe]